MCLARFFNAGEILPGLANETSSKKPERVYVKSLAFVCPAGIAGKSDCLPNQEVPFLVQHGESTV